MNVLSPQLRRAGLLGVLLLAASPSAGAPAPVGGEGYCPPGRSAGPGKGGPGAPKPPGGRQLVLQVRGSG